MKKKRVNYLEKIFHAVLPVCNKVHGIQIWFFPMHNHQWECQSLHSVLETPLHGALTHLHTLWAEALAAPALKYSFQGCAQSKQSRKTDMLPQNRGRVCFLSSVTKATASSGLRLGRLAIVLWKILQYLDYLNSGFHSCGLMGQKPMAQTGSSCYWLCWYTDLCLRTTSPMSSASIQETVTGWGAGFQVG